MAKQRLVTRSELPAPIEEAFAWHERPGVLQRLAPHWERTTVLQPPTSLAVGVRVIFRAGVVGTFGPRWVVEHVGYDPPADFRDVQRSGPFASWDHRHRFRALGPDTCELSDEVEYRLPLGALGDAVAGAAVRRRLQRMFGYRHRQTVADLAAHRLARQGGIPRMHVAITGASGLIGSALAAFLTTGGHTVTRLVRRAPSAPDEARWDPEAGTVDLDALRGVDAVVHLAADAISPRPLTQAKRRRLVDSRVDGTRTIATALAQMADGPRVLVSASGVNAYGDHGDEVVTEDTAVGGDGFLTDLVVRWEAAAQPARDAGLRVVVVRTGVVLDPKATILKVLGALAKGGVAAPLGSGRQWLPWITLDDTVGLYLHALVTPELDGPLNATAPNPVSNREFTRTLTRVLRRPMIPIAVPAALPRAVLGGELADDLLFRSMRVAPAKAEKTGYAFRHRDLETGLRHVLGRTEA